MRITTDRLSVLLDYGLSEYQARAYLALLEFPSLNAGTLAKVAQIPRNRLYESLEDLQSAGLVEIALHEGTRRYRAKPLSTFLDRMVVELRERIGGIEARKEYVSAAFQPTSAVDDDGAELGEARLVLGRRAAGRELHRMIDEAKQRVLVQTTAGGMERILRLLSSTAGRFVGDAGIEIEIYAPRAIASTCGIERLGEPFVSSLRTLDIEPSTILMVADDREMLHVQPLPDDAHPQTGRDFALFTTNAAFAKERTDLLRRAALASAAMEEIVRVKT